MVSSQRDRQTLAAFAENFGTEGMGGPQHLSQMAHNYSPCHRDLISSSALSEHQAHLALFLAPCLLYEFSTLGRGFLRLARASRPHGLTFLRVEQQGWDLQRRMKVTWETAQGCSLWKQTGDSPRCIISAQESRR